MDYFQIVYFVFFILLQICSLIMILFVIYAIIGLFKTRKYPHFTEQCSFGIVVSARNEEKVIDNVIKSVRSSNYPQDKLKIFVVAHNCTDKTAEVARTDGAIVYEYNNLNEARKGYALRYLFKQIEKDYKTTSLDGYIILDSDNTVASDYFSKMNDAFLANNKEHIITAYRNTGNMAASTISYQYGLFFILVNVLLYRGRAVCNVTNRITGTGFLVPSKTLSNGWNYVTLTEDLELTADEILNNRKIMYCDEAEFYDEQPTKFSVMYRQRLRWSKGLLIVFKQKAFSLFTSIFKKGKKHRLSTYDTFTNVLPYTLLLFFTYALEIICLLIGLIFNNSKSFYEVFLNTGDISYLGKLILYFNPNIDMTTLLNQFLYSNGILFALLRLMIILYFVCLLIGIILCIKERKRIQKVSFGLKLKSLLILPFSLFLQFVTDFNALVKPNVKWSTISHGCETKKK